MTTKHFSMRMDEEDRNWMTIQAKALRLKKTQLVLLLFRLYRSNPVPTKVLYVTLGGDQKSLIGDTWSGNFHGIVRVNLPNSKTITALEFNVNSAFYEFSELFFSNYGDLI